MKTKKFEIYTVEDITLKAAADILKSGEVLAFPTETVYGLGANALDEEAVNKIFNAKGRPSDNPLIVHVSSVEMAEELVLDISNKARILMDAFWPGPLTLIFMSRGRVARNVSGGLKTLAIRMPDHPIARGLIEACNLPIAAPSANVSGKPSPTLGDHVYEDLNGKIPGIVFSSPSKHGLESTILDMTKEPPVLLRPGGLTQEAIEAVIGPISVDPNLEHELDETHQPLAPGMKYKHYSPKGDLKIILGQESAVVKSIQGLILKHKPYKIGVMCCDETKNLYHADVVINLGSKNDLSSIATNLFHALRTFDQEGVEVILCEGYENKGLGRAVMNRLNKAAGYDIIYV
jgi:L-threonylcarbamoyladenylate synthase